MTPFGLIKMVTLPQKATNLVAPFVKIAHKVLANYISKKVEPFSNDIGIKELKNTYNNQDLVSVI